MTTYQFPHVAVPHRVYEHLRAGFIVQRADWALRHIIRCEDGGRLLHPGDPFGTVFAWVWQRDQDSAMFMLADYLAELRDHGPLAGEMDPPISLDEVLRGLRLALPNAFTDYDEVAHLARQGGVAAYYGSSDI